jgi:hypothetical protein
VLGAGWGVGFLGHFIWYLVRRAMLRKILKEYGITFKFYRQIQVSRQPRNSLAHYYEDASAAKKLLQNEIKNSIRLRTNWGGRETLLDHFTAQMKELVEREQAIAGILESVSFREVNEELGLAAERSGPAAGSGAVRSAARDESRRRSVLDWEEKRGLIGGKLDEALSFLKRTKNGMTLGMSGSENGKLQFVEELEEKSHDLALFLEDLRKDR